MPSPVLTINGKVVPGPALTRAYLEQGMLDRETFFRDCVTVLPFNFFFQSFFLARGDDASVWVLW